MYIYYVIILGCVMPCHLWTTSRPFNISTSCHKLLLRRVFSKGLIGNNIVPFSFGLSINLLQHTHFPKKLKTTMCHGQISVDYQSQANILIINGCCDLNVLQLHINLWGKVKSFHFPSNGEF